MNNDIKEIRDIRELGVPRSILLGLQHTFTLFASTVLVPILTGLDVGVALVMSGIGTLLFHFITQFKMPGYLGSSFSFIAPIIIAGEMFGLDYARGGIVIAGLIYVVVAGLIKLFGVTKILQFFPPVVTGPIIIIISMTLAPTAINMAKENWLISMFTLAVIIGVSMYSKGFFRLIPVIVGLIAGYVLAIVFNLVDFGPIGQAAWFGLPAFALPKFNIGAIAIIAPIALVTIVEHIGDVLAMSGVINRNLAVDPGLSRTLIGDGLATSVSALFGGPANTTYSQNTGVVALTRVYDSAVMRIAAGFAILIGLIPKINAITASIPRPVIGGAVIVLFGMIAAIGARTLVDNKVDFSDTRNMIIVAVILVFGLGGAVIEFNVGIVNIKLVGMALAAIIGIILNWVLPGRPHHAGHEEKLLDSDLI